MMNFFKYRWWTIVLWWRLHLELLVSHDDAPKVHAWTQRILAGIFLCQTKETDYEIFDYTNSWKMKWGTCEFINQLNKVFTIIYLNIFFTNGKIDLIGILLWKFFHPCLYRLPKMKIELSSMNDRPISNDRPL